MGGDNSLKYLQLCYNWDKENIGFMPKRAPRREKITFKATKKVNRPVKVSFHTRSGEKITFKATKKVEKPVTVTFYRKKK